MQGALAGQPRASVPGHPEAGACSPSWSAALPSPFLPLLLHLLDSHSGTWLLSALQYPDVQRTAHLVKPNVRALDPFPVVRLWPCPWQMAPWGLCRALADLGPQPAAGRAAISPAPWLQGCQQRTPGQGVLPPGWPASGALPVLAPGLPRCSFPNVCLCFSRQ